MLLETTGNFSLDLPDADHAPHGLALGLQEAAPLALPVRDLHADQSRDE